MTKIILEINQRLLLIKQNKKIQVCNYKDNYYGDQHCCSVDQVKLKQPTQ
ncbi:hypothetical protein [Brumicola blandensis]|jgi:hypothetical protein|uniref:Uncharacterized protein n=1 Tax=Brumicola blandensis TaxID=3075611 RepID=A0AAW8R479_9ALTE|nr:hypothetical protein [Alteromonas sp. W409]MDT0583214.1 hypothetical protein [Alteromonas sp. W409]